MNKDKNKKYEIKKGLKCCSVVDFETGCSDCPYRYRCGALAKDALNIITKQEKEIEQLTRECNQQAETLAEEQEACVECELEQLIEKKAVAKEIKKALEDHSIEKLKYQDGIKIKEIDFISILTLINELESENNELKNIKEYEK